MGLKPLSSAYASTRTEAIALAGQFLRNASIMQPPTVCLEMHNFLKSAAETQRVTYLKCYNTTNAPITEKGADKKNRRWNGKEERDGLSQLLRERRKNTDIVKNRDFDPTEREEQRKQVTMCLQRWCAMR